MELRANVFHLIQQTVIKVWWVICKAPPGIGGVGGRSKAQPSSDRLLRCILSSRTDADIHNTAQEVSKLGYKILWKVQEDRNSTCLEGPGKASWQGGIWEFGRNSDTDGKKSSFRDGEATRERVKVQWKGQNSNSSATKIISCVTLGRLTKLPGLRFSHRVNETNNNHLYSFVVKIHWNL